MPDVTFTDAAREAFASSPANSVSIETLEIRHPSLVDDNGNPWAARVVRAHKELSATLELDAPMNGGEEVLFTPISFNLELPGVDGRPADEITMTIDNVGEELMDVIETASTSQHKTEVTYRTFLSNDLSTPEQVPPATYTLGKASVGSSKITAMARISDLGRKPFPSELYSPERFPGLLR